MFEDFKKNLEVEKKLIARLRSENDTALKQSYVNQLKMLNAAISELLKKSSPVPSIRSGPINVVSVSHIPEFGTVFVLTQHQSLFLQEVKTMQKKSAKVVKEEHKGDFTSVKPSAVKSFANRFFRGPAEKLIPSMPAVSENIKKANLPLLPATYLAIALLFTFLSVFLGLAAYGVLLFLNLSNWVYFWVVFAVPGVVFMGFYLYPSSEAATVQKNILYELPFATIHMTAIAGSDIEPSKIFQIIAQSKEYPTIGREVQKILVLIRVYGYDLVTALKNVASRTSNKKFSELLGGLATNISGGGALKTYLEKKSENYLLDYQLERKRYIELAGTFMDIYISILIAAPMVLMLMFIIMNVAGLGFQGYSIQVLMIFSVFAIVIANILFLFVIHLKQPKV